MASSTPKKKATKKKVATKKTVKKKAPAVKKKAVKKTAVKKKAVKKKAVKKTVKKTAKKKAVKTVQTKSKKQKVSLYSSYEALEKASLPQNYCQTYVTLLSKEPYVLYAYWEIHGDDSEQLKKEIGPEADSAVYTLRVYDVTLVEFNGMNANSWFDLDELHMENRYISVGSDDATYVCEIGLRTQAGHFYSLARSNFIRAQRSGVSHRRDLIWKELADDSSKQNMFVNVRVINRSLRGRLKPRTNWQMDTSRLILNPTDIKLYYRKRIPMMKLFMDQISSQKQGKLPIKEMSVGNVQIEQTPMGSVATRTSENKTTGGASDQFYADKKKDTFPFELKMTVTVTGKTEPDAEVYLADKKIPLNANGTFTLNWNLEDGVLPLEFRARSPKKDLGKSILTSVIRTPTEEHY